MLVCVCIRACVCVFVRVNKSCTIVVDKYLDNLSLPCDTTDCAKKTLLTDSNANYCSLLLPRGVDAKLKSPQNIYCLPGIKT